MPLGLEEVALPFRHGPQELSGLSGSGKQS
jgi:hypothetical protein